MNLDRAEVVAVLVIVGLLAIIYTIVGLIECRQMDAHRQQQFKFYQLYRRWPYDDDELHQRRNDL